MDRLDEFVAALAAAGGTASCHGSHADAVDAVCDLVGDSPALVDADPVVAGVAERVTLAADPWSAQVGVTGAVAAVAETGTLALVGDASRPRRTALLPPRHVAVVSTSVLVPGYADAMDLLAARRPVPSAMFLLTGPSSSGDIEMTTVRGVHGPAEVHVVLYPSAPDPDAAR